MIRILTADDNAAVLNFLREEGAINLFMIGDIENFGFETDFQDVWADIGDDGIWRAVLLRYYRFYLVYAPGECDLDGLADIVRSDDQFAMLSGGEGAVDRLAERVPVGDCQKLYFAELTDGALLDGAGQCAGVSRATVDDLDGIFALRGRIEEFRSLPVSQESFRRGMETGTSRSYVYRIDGHIVASASTSAENSMSAMVVGVCTDPDHRRRGYASRCVDQLCRDILDEGRTLCLFYDNPAAGRIYKRMGFRDIGRWHMYHAAAPQA